jgi:ribokinase
MYDVITVGSAAVDAFVNTGSQLFKKSRLKNCVKVPFGSKILVEELNFEIGGAGTNIAVAVSRLGLKTAFIGSIGLGTNSQRVLTLLEKEKVDTDLIQKGEGRTGFSVILDAYHRDRTILVFKGSNDNLNFNNIPKQKLKTKWFYFSSMLNQSLETQKKLAEYAFKNKIKIAYNPSSYLIKKQKQQVKNILKKTKILILNREEAYDLVGRNKIKTLMNNLLKLGPELVVVTDGPYEVYASEGKHIYSLCPQKIKPLETTGAGDAFSSGFLAGIIKKQDIEFALKLGLVNSQSVILHYGAKNKLLTYKEALNRMKNITITKE